MNAVSTAEGIQLDETAVGSMGIEWTSRLALSRAAAECEVAVNEVETCYPREALRRRGEAARVKGTSASVLPSGGGSVKLLNSSAWDCRY